MKAVLSASNIHIHSFNWQPSRGRPPTLLHYIIIVTQILPLSSTRPCLRPVYLPVRGQHTLQLLRLHTDDDDDDSYCQGCPQDVKSQDRDETETFQKTYRDRSVAV